MPCRPSARHQKVLYPFHPAMDQQSLETHRNNRGHLERWQQSGGRCEIIDWHGRITRNIRFFKVRIWINPNDPLIAGSFYMRDDRRHEGTSQKGKKKNHDDYISGGESTAIEIEATGEEDANEPKTTHKPMRCRLLMLIKLMKQLQTKELQRQRLESLFANISEKGDKLINDLMNRLYHDPDTQAGDNKPRWIQSESGMENITDEDLALTFLLDDPQLNEGAEAPENSNNTTYNQKRKIEAGEEVNSSEAA
ncbi:hypothetical protein COLO4_36055 [Corchorus olitorius]|uniref:Uncharacterized protein n=1 Tax=Corchorus olitorius TaxID=93759 RepID=A0A1R3GB37_9ROSI|nr:hypothetical protein COLO4_36055 [Corchorus olitorius]